MMYFRDLHGKHGVIVGMRCMWRWRGEGSKRWCVAWFWVIAKVGVKVWRGVAMR
jgi:hypothetical protein